MYRYLQAKKNLVAIFKDKNNLEFRLPIVLYKCDEVSGHVYPVTLSDSNGELLLLNHQIEYLKKTKDLDYAGLEFR